MAGSSRLKRNGGEASLQQLLEGVLGNLDLGGKAREQLALRAWQQVARGPAGQHARAEALRDGVLIVATDNPAWAQTLHMQHAEWLHRLTPLVGEGVVREIHFRSGYRRPPAERPREERPADLPLSSRYESEIRRAVARIADPDLRARAERAFGSLARIAAWRKRTGWRRCARCGHWQRTGRRWCTSCLHRRGSAQ